ncbi:uromodulin-like [Cololabis saira]|uniref:uromodulin-like n=1 Tax=Cololabis saira TaxID=129043 RepID=UPI002AD3CC0F|nr:uromodulin-like [Cololabis saira]
MGVPGGVFFIILLHILTGETSGVFVSSCDSCHHEALCLASRERGDALQSNISCVCKDGFVGDGLTCYNTKLCSNSSCCRQGYNWSPSSGCVDIDECSLPDPPCSPPYTCSNTPGSFECLQLSGSRSGPSSQSVHFQCGNTVCPSGMDCIKNGGNNLQCADPCDHYTALHDDWRSINNTAGGKCDQHVDWQGWYRLFLGQTSAQIPETCTGENRCGTAASMWITEPHPMLSNTIVTRTVCSSWSGSCCYFASHIIHVKLCYANYYVYKLVQPSTCSLAYCADFSADFIEPPMQLVCGRNKLQVGLFVSSLAFSGLDPLSGHLANRNCSRVRVHGDVVWYEVEAQTGVCGNIMRSNDTHATYANSLFLYHANSKSFAPPERFFFSCSYPLHTDASLNVAIRPTLEWERGISGSGKKASAAMSLFRDSNYAETYPAGLVVLPVGSPLYVGISVDEIDPSFVAVLEDCFASHSSNPEDPMQYPLIQKKCPIDHQQVSVVESGSSLQARFSALLFLHQDEYRDIYLHCSLSLCDQRSSDCDPVCRSRSSRSVSSSAAVHPVTIGPIIWKK